MSRFRRRLTLEAVRNRPSAGELLRARKAAREADAAVREAEQDLQDFYASHGVPRGHDFLDEAARVLLSIPGVDIHREADRARLRVQLAAMVPHGSEYVVDEAIERALLIASAIGGGCLE
jgi:hypothetical protein